MAKARAATPLEDLRKAYPTRSRRPEVHTRTGATVSRRFHSRLFLRCFALHTHTRLSRIAKQPSAAFGPARVPGRPSRAVPGQPHALGGASASRAGVRAAALSAPPTRPEGLRSPVARCDAVVGAAAPAAAALLRRPAIRPPLLLRRRRRHVRACGRGTRYTAVSREGEGGGEVRILAAHLHSSSLRLAQVARAPPGGEAESGRGGGGSPPPRTKANSSPDPSRRVPSRGAVFQHMGSNATGGIIARGQSPAQHSKSWLSPASPPPSPSMWGGQLLLRDSVDTPAESHKVRTRVPGRSAPPKDWPTRFLTRWRRRSGHRGAPEAARGPPHRHLTMEQLQNLGVRTRTEPTGRNRP